MTNKDLNEREKEILRSIVNLYILKAVPVGSRKLSKFLEGKLSLSAASLRNIMSDLEELEYINHPHTSAGRIPTDKGYRFYVDSINTIDDLSFSEISEVEKLSRISEVSDQTLKDASKLLGSISNYLSIVSIPKLIDVIVTKIEIVSLSSQRLLVVLALESNLIRTVTLEANFGIEDKNIQTLTAYLNERISGKTLGFIRDNFDKIVIDYSENDSPMIRLFLDFADKIFKDQDSQDKILTSGTKNLISYPEFEDLSKVRSIIELVENKDMVIHLLDEQLGSDTTKVLIGSEAGSELLEDYSIVLSRYKIGSAVGSIGLIGPKRMNYAKMLALVNKVSTILSIDDLR
jgi:heat-inducible transcriptional repressor